MPSTDDLVQIVVTRKGPDEFSVILFNNKECVDRQEMRRDEAGKLVLKTMKQLTALPGLGD